VPSQRNPHTILSLIESHRVQVLPTSPSFLRLVCALPDDFTRDLSSLEVITYGSEPMDPTTLKRIHERFPTTEIVQKYGTTEVGSPRTASRGNESLWLRVKGGDTQVRVIDGILWLRSESTMLGYLNAPSPLDEAGWYCTGDLVEVDGDWIRFLGRADETIKVGGEKVSPSEVERVIRELDFVRDVAVSADPHPLLGQVIAARIALNSEIYDTRAVAARIRKHCRGRLPSHHIPVRVEVASADSFAPVGSRQKLQRRRPSTPNSST
jgi:acyl-coenzyme A synthetase/AMP-(fatty) acid ligase